MRLNIDVVELMGLMKAHFPDIDEVKLKSGLFDLMISYEKTEKHEVIDPEPRVSYAQPNPKRIVEVPEEAPAAAQDFAEISEVSSWGDLAQTASKPPAAIPGFDFEETEVPTVIKKKRRARSDAQQAVIDDISNTSSKDLLDKLIENHEKKTMTGRKHGQFVDVGFDGPAAGIAGDDEVFG